MIQYSSWSKSETHIPYLMQIHNFTRFKKNNNSNDGGIKANLDINAIPEVKLLHRKLEGSLLGTMRLGYTQEISFEVF